MTTDLINKTTLMKEVDIQSNRKESFKEQLLIVTRKRPRLILLLRYNVKNIKKKDAKSKEARKINQLKWAYIMIISLIETE